MRRFTVTIELADEHPVFHSIGRMYVPEPRSDSAEVEGFLRGVLDASPLDREWWRPRIVRVDEVPAERPQPSSAREVPARTSPVRAWLSRTDDDAWSMTLEVWAEHPPEQRVGDFESLLRFAQDLGVDQCFVFSQVDGQFVQMRPAEAHPVD